MKLGFVVAQDPTSRLLLPCVPCTPYCSLIHLYCLGGESEHKAGKWMTTLRVLGCGPYTWQPMHDEANPSLLTITIVATCR